MPIVSLMQQYQYSFKDKECKEERGKTTIEALRRECILEE
jgi:hypothetical protein